VFKTKWQRGLALVIATMLSVLGLGAGMQPAYATGNDPIVAHYQSGQPGDAIYIDNGGASCPGNENDVSTVKFAFTDSTNQVFRAHLSDTLAYSGGGLWMQAVWNIPKDVSLGAGTLKAECWLNGAITKEYEMASSFTIVPPTTALSVNSAHITDNLHVQSSTPCPAGHPYPTYGVWVRIFSVASQWSGAGTQYVTEKYISVWPLSGNSNWSSDITLDKDEFKVGATYTIRASCDYSSGQSSYNYDSLLFTVQPNTYVAMGDSYSSGQGSFNYDLPGGNCRRSTDSYAYYLTDNVPLDPPYFAACGGAVTDDLFNPNTVNTAEDAQVNHLDSYTAAVTLTIGGNDVGFVDAVGTCANYTGHVGYGCGGNNALTGPIDNRLSALAGTAGGIVYAPGGTREVHALTDVLTRIATEAPNAKIYIAGYPHLFGSSTANYEYDGNAPGAYKCVATSGLGPVVTYAFWDAEWLNSEADQLNQVIQDAVGAVQPLNVTYIAPSEFDGHGLCDSSSPYLNGVEITGFDTQEPESFHPNVNGMQLGYGVAFKNAIDK
jgi:hypothetical protein